VRVANIAALDTNYVSFSGNTMTVNAPDDLTVGTDCYIKVGNGAITDLAGNPWGGISNQMLAQTELLAKNGKHEKKIYVLPKTLDQKVARPHLAKVGVKLTTLRKDQADYIGVKPEGPFKPDHYRY
jgi:hypothetical protein